MTLNVFSTTNTAAHLLLNFGKMLRRAPQTVCMEANWVTGMWVDVCGGREGGVQGLKGKGGW